MRLVIGLLLLAAGLTALSQSARSEVDLSEIGWFMGPIIRIDDKSFQVRVDERVMIRIPRQTPAPVNMGNNRSSVASKAVPVRYKEQKVGKCLWLDKLAGTRLGTEKSLDLATRDGVLIRAYLGDGCLAREFYAGAYVERPLDGKLCVDRDLLHARTGAKCEVDRFRLLIPR